MWNTGWQFGDWLAPSTVATGADPVEMAKPHLRSEIVTAMFHAHSTRTVSEVAAVLGRADDAARMAARADGIRRAFAEEYLGDDGRMPLDLQGLYVLALAFDLVPAGRRPAFQRRLVELIRAAGDHLDTGFLATPHLLDVLWDAGERDVARDLLWQDSAPSWLYAVDRGATTVWESWEAIAPDGTPTRSSFNHYAFGAVDDWIMRRIGGIESTAPGYERVLIAPDVDGRITSSQCRVDTVRGLVAVEWERDARGEVMLAASIPSGTTARIAVRDQEHDAGPGRHVWTFARPGG
jgi:alpha-L-rhamnosidase